MLACFFAAQATQKLNIAFQLIILFLKLILLNEIVMKHRSQTNSISTS